MALRQNQSYNQSMKTCTFPNCDQPLRYKDFCGGHYQQRRVGKELTPLGSTVPRGRTHGFDNSGQCIGPECTNKAKALLRCGTHYRQFHLYGEMWVIGSKSKSKAAKPVRTVKTCVGPDCINGVVAKGLCSTHYQQQRVGRPLTRVAIERNMGRTCKGPECDRDAVTKGYCHTHYEQTLRGLEPFVIGSVLPGPTAKPKQPKPPKAARTPSKAPERLSERQKEINRIQAILDMFEAEGDYSRQTVSI